MAIAGGHECNVATIQKAVALTPLLWRWTATRNWPKMEH